ncbi:MAG: AzlC family ABC transporter permease, partial [Synechococcales cyanobacterium RM1_1_8]|nr:AzlC family ABC transporter permease [Synechococcales cyanobacterium RM1_1_8]
MASKTGLQGLGQGAIAGAGIVAGFLPIAIGFGALTLKSGISLGSTMGFSLWLFAGASQFALLEALMQGLSTGAALATVVVINLRHLPMSLAAQRRYGHLPRWQRWILCQGLVDETFALESSLKQPRSFGFFLGLHLACWGAWNIGTLLGYQFGAFLPERWLRFALPGLFFCLLLGNLEERLGGSGGSGG